MKQRISVLSRNLLPVIALFGAACAARPASAQFLYDVSDPNDHIHTEFIEPAILTSLTTVTSFTVNDGTGGAVTSEVLSPTSATSCPGPAGGPGPCIDLYLGSIAVSSNTMPTFTSVGTYKSLSSVGGVTTLTISAVPEPSSIVLLLTSLSAAVFVFRKRRKFRKLSA